PFLRPPVGVPEGVDHGQLDLDREVPRPGGGEERDLVCPREMGDLVGDGPSLRRGRTGPAPDVEVGDEGVEVGALGEEGGHGVAHGGERGTNSTNKQACLFYSPGIANVAACASPTSTSPSEPACAPSSRPRSIP